MQTESVRSIFETPDPENIFSLDLQSPLPYNHYHYDYERMRLQYGTNETDDRRTACFPDLYLRASADDRQRISAVLYGRGYHGSGKSPWSACAGRTGRR